MTSKKMLIDAAHAEETRVAVMDGTQLEELDVESAARRQLKGSIYLAKVTRVEPSLQAAFVDYGGNRHGFLAFSEIHPDYYQIPIADRQQLILEDEEARAANMESDDDAEKVSPGDNNSDSKGVETVGGDEFDEVENQRRNKSIRRYKIQEVIKRRQILLVQIVKEERGNKGAALTTYLSLAGRYCVLMPNTGKGGGISRKIGNGADRKRLKTIVSGLKMPEGMALIVRTAGAERTKADIKRDFEYLIRLWNDIRELTLESNAPTLIHEEANIIKRALRDTYARDFEEVLIEGTAGYKMAKELMKKLIPSHAKKIQPYKDTVVPLFSRFQIEAQLESMINQTVKLKSGGYLVINPTEALVAVDVNSGRATRGRNIEETALKTNLEAATELARQVRLRDLAGLIVVDFIDMDVHRNQTAVERRLKESMHQDRAKIQIGRISPFGLLELSRQRLRPSITETTTDTCPHCSGTGIRRSTESSAVHVLRGIEEEAAKNTSSSISVSMPTQVAIYLLNNKREAIEEIEKKFETRLIISEDAELIPPDFSFANKPANTSSSEKKRQTEKASKESDAATQKEDPKKRRRRRPRHRKKLKDDKTIARTKAGNKETAENHTNTPRKTSKDDTDHNSKVSNNTKSVSGNLERTERRGESVDLKGENQRDLNKNAKAKEASTSNDIETEGPKIKEKLDVAPNTDTSKNNSNPPNVTIIGDNRGDSEPPKRGWWQKLVE